MEKNDVVFSLSLYRNTLGQWIKALFILIAIDVLFYLLVYASQQLVSPISRRMANLSFVLWQVYISLMLNGLMVPLNSNFFTDALAKIILSEAPRKLLFQIRGTLFERKALLYN